MTYVELFDEEYERIKEISRITVTDYELKGNLISTESLLCALDDMLSEYHHKEEEIEDIINNRDEFWERKRSAEDDYEFYGVSRNDFI